MSKSSTELDANPAVGKSAVQRLVMLPVNIDTGEIDYDYVSYRVQTREQADMPHNLLIEGWEYKEFEIVPAT